MEGYKLITVENCMQRGNITTTGYKDILNSEHFMLMKYDAIVLNIGNFDCQIQFAPPPGRQPAEPGEAALPSRLTIPPQIHLHMTSTATLIYGIPSAPRYLPLNASTKHCTTIMDGTSTYSTALLLRAPTGKHCAISLTCVFPEPLSRPSIA